MAWRRSKKPTLSRDQALDARPIRNPGATVHRNGQDAGGRITVLLQPPRWSRWLLKRGAVSEKNFELDSVGLFVWDQCSGRVSVKQMIQNLAAEYNLNLREAEVSLIQFLQTLARKGLIGMEIKE